MDRTEYAQFVATLSRQLFGDPTLAEADAILVVILVEYVRALPALGGAAKVAIKAIVQVSHTDPAGARELARELRTLACGY